MNLFNNPIVSMNEIIFIPLSFHPVPCLFFQGHFISDQLDSCFDYFSGKWIVQVKIIR